jgi:glycogen operon protein
MLSMGDEVGRTQRGNNNAYCQDNELSWVDWDLDPPRRELLAFARAAVALRRAHPVLRRATFLNGEGPGETANVRWLRADGAELTHDDWHDPAVQRLTLLLPGAGAEAAEAATIVILLNATAEDFVQRLPVGSWTSILDTRGPRPAGDATSGEVRVPGYGLLVLQQA